MSGQIGKSINLNIIQVCGDFFTDDDEVEIEAAVLLTSALYALVGLCLGDILHFNIPWTVANKYYFIDSDA